MSTITSTDSGTKLGQIFLRVTPRLPGGLGRPLKVLPSVPDYSSLLPMRSHRFHFVLNSDGLLLTLTANCEE